MSIVSELNVTTRQNFMPLVTNQIYTKSPVLERIFGIADEQKFGTGVKSYDGQNIVETIRVGNVAESANTYNTGTIGVTKGATTVTGTNTVWTSAMAYEGQIVISSQAYRIKSVASNTSLELLTPFEGTTIEDSGTYVITYYSTVSNTSGAYNTSTQFSGASQDTLGGATYDWKMYHTTVNIHNKYIHMNAGKSKIIDLVAEKLQSATTKLGRDLITDFYASNTGSGDNMVGIGAFVGRTGTVGGIDKGAYAWWQGFCNTSTSNRALTEQMLNKMYHLTKRYGDGDKATLMVTTEGVLEYYETTLTSVKSAAAAPNLFLTADANAKGIDTGIVDFRYKGIDIIADPNMPTTNTLYFLNENYLNWRVLKAFASDEGWVDLTPQGYDKIQLTINGYGALTCTGCSKLGVINYLTEA